MARVFDIKNICQLLNNVLEDSRGELLWSLLSKAEASTGNAVLGTCFQVVFATKTSNIERNGHSFEKST